MNEHEKYQAWLASLEDRCLKGDGGPWSIYSTFALEQYFNDVRKLEADNARLREALKPFADFALRFIEHIAGDNELFTHLDGEHKLLNYSNSPTLSDLRKTYFAMKEGDK